MLPEFIFVTYDEGEDYELNVSNVEFPKNKEDLLDRIIDFANERTLDLTDEEHITMIDDLCDTYRLKDHRINIENLQRELIGKAFSK